MATVSPISIVVFPYTIVSCDIKLSLFVNLPSLLSLSDVKYFTNIVISVISLESDGNL